LADVIESVCELINRRKYVSSINELNRTLIKISCDTISDQLAKNNIESSKIKDCISVIKEALTKKYDEEDDENDE
jgi:predicted transcriptional regulator